MQESELNNELLISAEYLWNLIETKANYKLNDVSFCKPNDHYMIRHIPTSIHLDTCELEEPPIWNRKRSAQLIELAAELGIKDDNNDELIIFYGNPEPVAAYRAAVIFKWLSVNNVRILNGGFQCWLEKNSTIEIISNKRISIERTQKFFNAKKSTYIVDIRFVQNLVENFDSFQNDYCLVDIRSWKEFCGQVSGYNGFVSKGRIPYSKWGKAGSTSMQLEDYRTSELKMKPSKEILEMWKELGIDYEKKHLVFYCGTGWRAAECLIYAEVMGLKKISLYDGGWFEWVSLDANKIETGAP